jgi:hypothetical protein
VRKGRGKNKVGEDRRKGSRGEAGRGKGQEEGREKEREVPQVNIAFNGIQVSDGLFLAS